MSKDDARAYLSAVIRTVKKEIGTGIRPQNNLNPEESLDFCILPILGMVYDKDILRKRGWKVE
jgi:hypothetical protein